MAEEQIVWSSVQRSDEVESQNKQVVLWLYTNQKASKQLKPKVFQNLCEHLERFTKNSHPNEDVTVTIYHVTVDQAYNAPDLFIKGEWAVNGSVPGYKVFWWEENIDEGLKQLEEDAVCGRFLKYHSWRVSASDGEGAVSELKSAEQPIDELEEWM